MGAVGASKIFGSEHLQEKMDVSLKTLLHVSTLRARRPERLATLKKPYFIAYYDGPLSRGETWETLKRQHYIVHRQKAVPK